MSKRSVAYRGPLIAVAIPLAVGCSGAPREDPERRPAPAGASVAVLRECGRAAAPPQGVVVVEHLPYRTADGEVLALDLAHPAGAIRRPAVLLLHGGGWSGGSRGAMRSTMRLLAGRGYVAATASYRLTQAPRNIFPAALEDVRCALRWLRENAGRFGGDGERIAVLGYSAGAHLASMVGVAATGPGTGTSCELDTAAVRAVVSMAGPQDLRVRGRYTDEQARLVTNFLGVFSGDAPELAEAASPLAHVGSGDAPFLLVHGARDDLVPPQHGRWMRRALQEAGVPATLLELRGVGHTFVPLDSRDEPVVGCTVLAFLERWLGNAGDQEPAPSSDP